MEDFDEKHVIPYMIWPCGHNFCKTCLDSLENKTICPNCRGPLDNKTINLGIMNLVSSNKQLKNKLKETMTLLQEANELYNSLDVALIRIEDFQKEAKVNIINVGEIRLKKVSDWNRRLKNAEINGEQLKKMIDEMRKVREDLKKCELGLDVEAAENLLNDLAVSQKKKMK